MPTILVASDSVKVREDVEAALVRPGFSVEAVERGQDVVPYVAATPPDLVILDMQIGNMGGPATAMELQLEQSADRCAFVPILLLLDREADRFLARRADVDAMLVKPYDPGTLRRTVIRILDEQEREREQRRAAEMTEAAAAEDDLLPGPRTDALSAEDVDAGEPVDSDDEPEADTA